MFLFCYVVLSLHKVKSQQQSDIDYFFEQDSIQITSGQTFSNKLIIINRTGRAVKLSAEHGGTKSLQGLIKLPASIQLSAHETKILPLKYIADRVTVSKAVQKFCIGLITEEKSISMSPPQAFYTLLNEEQSLLIQPDQAEYYFDQSTGQAQLLIRILNTSLVPLTFQLHFPNLPSGLEVIGETLPTTVPAGGQSLARFTAHMRNKRIATDAELIVEAIASGGKLLAVNRIRIMSVGSVKRFGSARDLQNQPYENMIALRYLSMGHNFDVYQLQSYGNLELKKGKSLDYRLNLDYFRDQSAFNMYDSYVDYQTEKWALKAGNVYENLDQYINGRGVKASYKLDSTRSISAYLVQNNYLLWSQMNTFNPGGAVVGAKYAFLSKNKLENSLTYLHATDNYRNIRSHLLSGKGSKDWGESHQLTWEAGASTEHVEGGGSKTAGAGGFNYHATLENIQIASSTYYSSPYYVGLRRGLLQTDSRMSISLSGKRSVSARLSYMNNRPKYMQGDRNYRFDNSNRIEIYELGYRSAIGKLNIDLRPYVMRQQANYQSWLGIENNVPEWKSSSLRAVADLNFFSESHRFSFQTDYGYTYKNTANRPMAPFHSLRISGNYDNSLFGFNAFVQVNPFYLSDLLATYDNAKYRIYSLGPNTRFEALAHKLQVQLAALYSYYGFSRSNNFSINGNARWRLKDDWNLTADIFYTFIKGRSLLLTDPMQLPQQHAIERYSFDSRQIRVGVEKNFGRRAGDQAYRLQLNCFDDKNNNGIKDADELPVESVVVRIGRDAAITDRKGKVKFVDMIAGTYNIQVENSAGWVSYAPLTAILTKNRSMDVPLIRTKPARGKIRVITIKYLDSKPDLSGIRITAVDRQGKTYHTLTNEEGSYAFFLPAGIYKIMVLSEGMPFSIENPDREVEIKSDGTSKLPTFNYKDLRRKVGVKRF